MCVRCDEGEKGTLALRSNNLIAGAPEYRLADLYQISERPALFVGGEFVERDAGFPEYGAEHGPVQREAENQRMEFHGRIRR
jgi:hypothetical protein